MPYVDGGAQSLPTSSRSAVISSRASWRAFSAWTSRRSAWGRSSQLGVNSISASTISNIFMGRTPSMG